MHEFRVTMLLADAAQGVGGKLYILGGGWSIIGPDPSPMAVVVHIKTPWHQAQEEHAFRLQLLDADGLSVTLATEAGDAQVAIEGGFQCGEPVEGIKAGTPLDASFAVNIGPMPLDPGTQYEWRLWINEQTREDWNLGFTTRPAPASQAA